VFVVTSRADGVFTVRHTAADDLAADNQATVVSQLPQPVKVLLVSRGNRFLEKAVRAAGDVELSLATEAPADAGDWDVVMLDDVMPAVWPVGNVLAVRVMEPGWFEPPAWCAPAGGGLAREPSLMRFVNLDNVQIAAAAGWGRRGGAR
jgi:hypothetical protein